MGVLRLFLAFCVFVSHADIGLQGRLLPPDTAVHAFYVISGFYMALVLGAQPARSLGDYGRFLASRWLRLWPAYAVVALLTAVLAAGFPGNADAPPALTALQDMITRGATPLTLAPLALAQLSLIGLDLPIFLGWQPESGYGLLAHYQSDSHPLYRTLLVPQAWSLSLELYFYLLAPWLVRLRTGRLLALVAASLALRMALAWVFDLRSDPWSYRFFPAELAFFLCGVIAERAARPGDWRMLTALGLALGLADWWAQAHAGTPLVSLLRIPFLTVLVALLPTLFALTRDWRVDRRIGELSYPLYVSHLLVVWAVAALFPDAGGALRVGLLVAGALAAAAALYALIDAPMARWRHRLTSARKRHPVHAPGKREAVALEPEGALGR